MVSKEYRDMPKFTGGIGNVVTNFYDENAIGIMKTNIIITSDCFTLLVCLTVSKTLYFPLPVTLHEP